MINQTLHNRYTLIAHIGSGAMGTVYRATDAQSGDEVAVKVLNRELAFSPELLERFRREGEALRQLRHPNIVGLVDAFQHEGQQVIVMEYVAGGSLHSLIKQGPLPADHARKIALGLCDALTRAHDLGIIHRDIKPENILVAADGTPKLTDFGIARLLTEGTRITHSGVQVGTPYYMSPEAWEGKPLDAQADIWSLGIVLFEMLAGEVPFPGDTVIAVMHKVLTAPLPELKQARPDAPEGLAQIVRRMMTRDKAVRYQTMREVGLDLERGEPVRAIPSQAAVAPAQPSPVAKRKLSLTRVLIGGIVVLGAGALLFAVFGILAPQFDRFLLGPPQVATQPTPVPTVAPVSPVATLPPNTAMRTPTPVPDSLAEQARAFAEPILAAIANRAPDHEDDFSDPGSGWPSGSMADGSEMDYKGGAYFISGPYLTLPDLDHCTGAAPDRALRFSDFVLEVEAQFISGEWGNWYIIIRDSPGTIERPTSIHYGVQFDPGGAGRIYKNVGGTDIPLNALTFEQGFGTNRLMIIARGPQIAVYVNGEPLGVYYDESSSEGMIQLGICNDVENTTLEVHFDNLQVWDITDLSP